MFGFRLLSRQAHVIYGELHDIFLWVNVPMSFITHDGSMVLLYMVTWIPSIYPLYVSIYTSTMDPMGNTKVPLEMS